MATTNLEPITNPEPHGAETVDLPRELQVQLMRDMLRIRRLEERCSQLYGEGKIGGFCHLYLGQEAVAVGALATVRPDDYIITTYRDHGMAMLRGVPPESVFGELMGREIGCSKGRGGSMHLFNKETNFMGGHGIVGAHIPLGTGAAFASKYRGEDRIAMCFFGEGAVNNGAFHESLNLGSLWKLPVIFICENNRYGMGTPIERASSVYDIHKKAEGYDMEHQVIDGMNVYEVYSGVKQAVVKARQNRPSFLEIRTYRFRGHSMSDPIHSHYRTKAEVEEQKQRDPLAQWRESLIKRGIVNDEDLKTMDRDIIDEMKKALALAEASPEPDPATATKYVFKE